MRMRFIPFFTLFSLLACSEDDTTILDKETESVTDESKTNGRHADGAGTGDPTVNFGSVGNSLRWNGDGRWYSNLFGSPVWFFGPTPQQLQNGIQGTWQVACAYYTPNECYPNGFVVDGNGAGFTVFAPACAEVVSSSINFPKLVFDHKDLVGTMDASGQIVFTYVNRYRWENHTITVKSLSGGNCKLQASGKVIVNSDCKPVIVSPESVVANLCGQPPVWVE